MNYRIVRTPEDIVQANDCIASTGYYDAVDLATVGGLALAAFDENDDCCGVVWVAISGKLAILDYLAVRHGTPGWACGYLLDCVLPLSRLGFRRCATPFMAGT
jgi:hypothetical protein